MSLTSLVKQARIDLCIKRIKKHVILDLPLLYRDKVILFSKIAGIDNLECSRKSGKYILGCYRIWGLNKPNNYSFLG